MGAPISSTATPAPSKRSRAQPTADSQTQFLYLILKQLDLKSVNWQEVADGIGIKNGHAARMRWSRYKAQVEGLPTQHQKKQQQKKKEGDGKDGSCRDHFRDPLQGFKRGFGHISMEDAMADDDCETGDQKRVKREPGCYGPGPIMGMHGMGPPPPGWHHPYGPPPLPPGTPMSYMGPPPPYPMAKPESGMHIKQDPGDMPHHPPPPPTFHSPYAWPPIPPNMIPSPTGSGSNPSDTFKAISTASTIDPDDLPIKQTQATIPSTVSMFDLQKPLPNAMPIKTEQAPKQATEQAAAAEVVQIISSDDVQVIARPQTSVSTSKQEPSTEEVSALKTLPLSAIPEYKGGDPNEKPSDPPQRSPTVTVAPATTQTKPSAIAQPQSASPMPTSAHLPAPEATNSNIDSQVVKQAPLPLTPTSATQLSAHISSAAEVPSAHMGTNHYQPLQAHPWQAHSAPPTFPNMYPNFPPQQAQSSKQTQLPLQFQPPQQRGPMFHGQSQIPENCFDPNWNMSMNYGMGNMGMSVPFQMPMQGPSFPPQMPPMQFNQAMGYHSPLPNMQFSNGLYLGGFESFTAQMEDGMGDLLGFVSEFESNDVSNGLHGGSDGSPTSGNGQAEIASGEKSKATSDGAIGIGSKMKDNSKEGSVEDVGGQGSDGKDGETIIIGEPLMPPQPQFVVQSEVVGGGEKTS